MYSFDVTFFYFLAILCFYHQCLDFSQSFAYFKISLICLDGVSHSLNIHFLSVQVRAGLEKAKQALEKESADLSADLRSLASAKQDLEHKKKKVEGQLNDLHSRFNESERQKTELGERVSKMNVSHKKC